MNSFHKARRCHMFTKLYKSSIFALFCITLLFSTPSLSSAADFTAATLADYGDITVMEVTGTYDANLNNGEVNAQARQVITQEFYKNHSDEYDFFVIISNFDFQMLEQEAIAFYLEVKNDVQGIGKNVFDSSSSYGSGGKLQGAIDMGNIQQIVSDPLDPHFSETMGTLSHELLHRWTAEVTFQKPDGSVSNDLLGKGGTHWSYLLDTKGSLQYGNNWVDNGNGTYSSRTGRRYYSPLDLYLMGFVDKTEVSPMLLIENLAIDPALLPESGVTIEGMTRDVTIEDIISAEGERVPDSTDSQKAFKLGCIFIARPGTFSEQDLYGIRNIMNQWPMWFSGLTNGIGKIAVDTAPFVNIPENPGIETPPYDPRTAPPEIQDGVAWLLNRQKEDGSWQDVLQTAERDTSDVLLSLSDFPEASQQYSKGISWLSNTASANLDYLARKIELLSKSGNDISGLLSELFARQNPDGGWGSNRNYLSNPTDTSIALLALSSAGETSPSILGLAVDYLKSKQNADGGWGSESGSNVQTTVNVLSVFGIYKQLYQLGSQIQTALGWLSNKQNPDGGFGNSPSAVYSTAAALIALTQFDISSSVTAQALSYIQNLQSVDGSWYGSPYQTALAVEAMWKSMREPDLSLTTADITFSPENVDSLPKAVELTVTIHNTGMTDVQDAKVVLYENAVSGQNKLTEQTVAVYGQSCATAIFQVTINNGNGQYFYLSVDPDNLIKEASEQNNTALRILFPESTYDFEVFSTDLNVTPETADYYQEVVIHSRMSNNGTLNAYNVPLRYFLDLPEGPNEIATVYVDLPAGGTINHEYVWVADTPGVSLPLKVIVDPISLIPELSEINNEAGTTITVNPATQPNLIVTYDDIAANPAPANERGSTALSASISNNGFSPAENVSIQFYQGVPEMGGGLLGMGTIPAIGIGGTETVSYEWADIPEAGEKIITVVVDPDNAINEISENDNRAFNTLQILTLPDFTLSTRSITFNPAAPREGDLLVVEVFVQNAGEQEVSQVPVALHENGNVIGEEIITSISGNSQSSVSFTYDTTAQTGLHTITAEVDPHYTILEQNEGNNTASRSFGVQDANLSVTEQYISPNADGIQDITDFFFRLESPRAVEIVIVNELGKIVRTFSGIEFEDTAGGAITWDGLDDLGRVVADGQYQIQVQSMGLTLSSLVVVVDNNQPSWTAAADSGLMLQRPFEMPDESVWLPDESGFISLHCGSRPETPDCGLFYHSIDGATIIRLTPEDWNDEDTGGSYDHLRYSEINNSGDYFTVSADGVKAAFVLYGYNKTTKRYEYILWSVGTSGENLQIVESVASSGAYFTEVYWSPDRLYKIIICKADGSERVEITPDWSQTDGSKQIFRWSPSGKKIAFTSGTNLVTVSLTGQQTNVFPIKSPIVTVEWFNDDKLLLRDFYPSSIEYDLWIIDTGLQKQPVKIAEHIESYHHSFDPSAKVYLYYGGATSYAPMNPDRKHFIYSPGSESDATIMVCNGNGDCTTAIEEITNIFQYASNVSWSPDGKKLFVEAYYDGVFIVYEIKTGQVDIFPVDTTEICSNTLIQSQTELPANYKIWPPPDGLCDEDKKFWPTVYDSKWISNDTLLTKYAEVDVPNSKRYDYYSTFNISNGRITYFPIGDPDTYPNMKYVQVSPERNYIFGHGYLVSSLLPLTAELQATRNEYAVTLKGIAADLNFSGWTLEYADQQIADDWHLITPPSEQPVIDDLFTEWMPPYEGSFFVRLTVSDKAGNTKWTRKRVTWGKKFAITNMYKSGEIFSPNNDGVDDNVALHFTINESVHLDFDLFDSENNLIRTFQGDYALPGPHSLAWDGLDNKGNIVPDGTYRMQILGYNFFFEVDNTPPVAGLRFDEIVFDSTEGLSAPLSALVEDINLKGWALEYGEGVNPNEWYLSNSGNTAVRALNSRGELLLDEQGNHLPTEITLFPEKDPGFLINKRFRLVAEDFVGNTSVIDTIFTEEIFVLRKWDAFSITVQKNDQGEFETTDLLPAGRAQPELHSLKVVETILPQLVSMTVQYRLNNAWHDDVEITEFTSDMPVFEWDASGLDMEKVQAVRIHAWDGLGREFYSNAVQINSEEFAISLCHTPEYIQDVIYADISLYSDLAVQKIQMQSDNDPEYLEWTDVWEHDATTGIIDEIVSPPPAGFISEINYKLRMVGITDAGKAYISNIENFPPGDCKKGQSQGQKPKLNITYSEGSDCDTVSTSASIAVQLKGVVAAYPSSVRYYIEESGSTQLLRHFDFAAHGWGKVIIDTTAMPEGVYPVSAVLEYENSNEQLNGSLLVDRELPQSLITYPDISADICPRRIGSSDDNSWYGISIEGIAADNFNVDRYELYYGAEEKPDQWLPAMTRLGCREDGSCIISGGAKQGLLGIWDVTNLTGSIYTLKLKVVDTSGNIHCSFTTIAPDNMVHVTASIDKKLISPNSDGDSDNVSLFYSINETATLDIEVYGPFDSEENISIQSSSLVRSIVNGMSHLGGIGAVDWDGKDNSGSIVPDGWYALVLAAVDSCGNIHEKSFHFKVDNTPPTTILTSPISGGVLGIVVDVRGSASDINFAEYQLIIKNQSNPGMQFVLGGNHTPVENDMLGTWNTFGLPEGMWDIKLTARDRAGNSSELILPVNLEPRPELIKSLSAEPRIFSPNNDGKRENTQIQYELADTCDVTVDVLDSSNTVVLTSSRSTLPPDIHTYQWDGKDAATNQVPDGIYHAEINASLSSNPSIIHTESISVEIDTALPMVVIDSPLDNSYIGGDRQVTGTITDVNLTEYSISYTGPLGTQAVAKENQGRENHTFAIIKELAEGNYLLTALASDKAENIAQQNIAFVIDNTPPQVTLTSPVDGEYYGSGNDTLIINGAISEDNLERYTLRYGPGEDPGEWTLLVSSEIRPEKEELYPWDIGHSSGVTDNTYTLSLLAVDKVGRETEKRAKIIVDNTPPVVEITSLSDGGYIKDTVEIIGTASDQNISKYTVQLSEGECSIAYQWLLLNKGSVSVEQDILARINTLPNDGAYCLQATVVDKLGNETVERISVRVDSRPPAPPSLSGALQDNQDVSLSWAHENESDVSGYNLYRNSQRLNTDLMTERLYSDLSLPEGNFTYNVTAVDTAGWESDFSNPFQAAVDNTGPEAWISLPLDGITVSDLVDIKGTASSSDDFKEYRILIGSGVSPSGWQLIRKSPVPIRSNTLYQWDTVGFGDNVYSVKLEAEDIHGNISSEVIIVTVDNTPPSPPILISAVPSGDIVDLSWQENNEADLAGYLLYRNHQLVNVTGPAYGDLKPYLLSSTNYTDTDVPDGILRYYLVAMDEAGNTSDQSNILEIKLDNHAPKASIIEPENGHVFQDPLILRATSDDFDIAEIQFQFKKNTDSSWSDLGNSVSLEPFVIELNPVVLQLEYGDYDLRAVATDYGGLADTLPVQTTVTYTDLIPPGAPAGLSAQIAGGIVTLTWSDNTETDLAGYNVYLWNSKRNTELVTTPSIYFPDGYGLFAGEYSFHVAAVDVYGNESEMTQMAVTVPGVILLQPQNVVPDSTVILEGTTQPEMIVEIFKNTTVETVSLGTVSIDAEGNFVFDANLTPGEKSFFAVSSDLQGNSSRPSNTVVVIYNEPPTAPTGLSATVNGYDVGLSWNVNPEPDVIGYYLHRDGIKIPEQTTIDNNELSVIASNNSSYAYRAADNDPITYWSSYSHRYSFGSDWWQAVLPSQCLVKLIEIDWGGYSYRLMAGKDFTIRGWNGIGWDTIKVVSGNTASHSTIAISPPYRTDRIQIYITDTTDTDYYKYVRINEVRIEKDNLIDATSYIDASLPDGEYTYQLSALDEYGFEGQLSDGVTALVGDIEAPAAPENLVADVVDADVSLSWSQKAEPDLAGYRVYRDNGQEWILLNTSLQTDNFYSDTNLKNGTHAYRVTAVDMTGNESEPSLEIPAVIAVLPPLNPTNLHVTAPLEGGMLEICWNAPAAAIEGYALYRSMTSGGPYDKVSSGLIHGTCYMDQGLTNGSTYYYVAAGVDSFGNESGYSNEGFATPEDFIAPDAPLILEPTVSGYPVETVSEQTDVSGIAEPGVPVALYNNGDLVESVLASSTEAIQSKHRSGLLGDVAISPDGQTLAYNYSDIYFFLYKIHLNKNSSVSKSSVSSFAWSDSGDKLAYVYQTSGYSRIGIYDINSSIDTNLTDCADCSESYPSWSGDGKVAFISDMNGSNDIWIKDLVSGVISQVSNVVLPDYAEISPNAGMIAYFENQALSVIDLETSEITEIDALIDRTGDLPAFGWSPDGSRLAFVSSRNGAIDIHVHDFGSGQTLQVSDTNQAELDLTWSFDGKSLAYVKEMDADSWEVRIISADEPGEDRIVEVVDTDEPSDLSWRSSWLYYMAGNYLKTVQLAGAFIFEDVTLNAGENTFSATATDESGNTGAPSDEIIVYLDPSMLPDLEVTDDDIFIFPAAPLEGQGTVISAPVKNIGSFDLEDVDASIYVLDATGRLELAKSATIPYLAAGWEEWLSFTWDSTGKTGKNSLYVTIDPQNVFNEASEANNFASRDFYVVEEFGLSMNALLDSDQYRSYDYVSVTIDLLNSGLEQDVTLDITIEDENGYLVENVESLSTTLIYGAVENYFLYWNTTDIFAGNYQLRATLKDLAGEPLKETILPFVILPDLDVEASVSTSQTHYGPNETVSVNMSVKNNGKNASVSGLDVLLKITDSTGNEALSGAFMAPILLSGSTTDLKTLWNTGLSAPGEYLMELSCTLNGETVVQDSTSISVDAVAELSGTIAADPEVVTYGNGVVANYTLSNIGNASAGSVELNFLLLDSLSSTVVASKIKTVAITLGDTLTGNVAFSADLLKPGNYTTLMQAYHDQAILHVGDAILTVKDLRAPVVEIISPVQGSTLNGVFDLEVKATDDASGVSGVEYRLDSRAWLPLPLTSHVTGSFSLAYIPLAEDEGEHTFQFRGRDNAGNVSSPVSSTVTIELCNPFDELSGTVAIDPDPLYLGQDISVAYQISNGCTKELHDLTVRLHITDPATGSAGATFVSTVNVPSEGDDNGLFTLSSLDLNVQLYDVLLGVEIDGESGPKTLATSSLEVLPALEVVNSIADQSNVLVWLNHIKGNDDSSEGYPVECANEVRLDLLTTMLDEAVDKYRIVCDKSEFEQELRNPFFTDILILGNQQPLTDHHIDELMEKVYSGTGLVSAGWLKHGTHFEGENIFLGINDKGTLAGSQHEIQLLDSPITTADVWSVTSYALRVETAANATVAGWILGNSSNNYPAIVLSDYGMGRTIFYAFDLSEALTDQNFAEFSELLTLSFSHVHRPSDQAGVKPPYHMVPHALTTASPGRGFDLNVSIFYPPELAIFDTQTDSWIVDNPWLLNLPVASGGTIEVQYSILMPDASGTYSIFIENGFMDQDQYIPLQTDTYDLVLDQDRAALIDSIIGEVSSLPLTNQDSAKVVDIIICLENVRTNTIIDIGDLQVNIHEIEKAVDALLQIEGVDISDIRLQLDTLLRIEQGRYYFYE